MNLPYRLIALDVDGTLLNDDHEMTEGTKDVLRRASAAGAGIVLCTGRGPTNTFYLLEELGLSGVLITHNGATTIRSTDRSLVHSFELTIQDIECLLMYCRDQGIHYNVNTIFDLYVDRINPIISNMYEKFGIAPVIVDDILLLQEPLYKFTIFGSPEVMDRLTADWEGIGCKLAPIRSDARFIDVMHSEASKGSALRQLASLQGIPREQVLAIGNYYNDMDMLQFAGLGVAMENSPLPVKEAADEVTLTNNEEGVRAVLLKRLLLNASF